MFSTCETISLKEFLNYNKEFINHISPYIYEGFRIPKGCFSTTLQSIFQIHNEYMNIWTHVIGSLIFIYLFGSFLFHVYQNKSFSYSSFFIISFYLLSALFVFTSSSIYHIFNHHSIDIANKCLCLDWFSVTLLVLASNLYTAYFSLYQNQHFHTFYVFLIINLIIYVYLTYQNMYSLIKCYYFHQCDIHKDTKEEIKNIENEGIYEKETFWRVMITSLFGLGVFIAWLLHYILSKYTDTKYLKMILLVYLFHGFVVFKAFSIPERFAPHLFHTFGSSHQIFHTGSVIGTLLLYFTYQPFQSYIPEPKPIQETIENTIESLFVH
jgi:adiponectin receptor